MSKTLLITGGAGFIGTNAANYFSRRGFEIIVLDNLSRNGTEKNMEWLKATIPFSFIQADIRNYTALSTALEIHKPDAILHLAGQVAVTTSVSNPREDFEINALGTFNLLEAARTFTPRAPFIYASTNKVYGKMESVAVHEHNGRHEYVSRRDGICEDFPLDFHSPYGCSKGAGDQYVLDYHRIYGLPTASFRQSCIYGPRQFGIEDQGWVAWFIIACQRNKPITIYGDGKQIRDILFVDDLLHAYEQAIADPDQIGGQAYNIGGGPENTLSLLELIEFLEERLGKKIPVLYDKWRAGDQKVFVCNIQKANEDLEWHPNVRVKQGVQKLFDWVKENSGVLDEVLGN